MGTFGILVILALVYAVFKFLNMRAEFRRRDAEKAAEECKENFTSDEKETDAEENFTSSEDDQPEEYVLWEEE